jgi:hypothetical protein
LLAVRILFASKTTTNRKEDIMAETHNYIETEKEREEGHVDTRERNFECESKDPRLGCNLGIDVAG